MKWGPKSLIVTDKIEKIQADGLKLTPVGYQGYEKELKSQNRFSIKILLSVIMEDKGPNLWVIMKIISVEENLYNISSL